MHNLQIEQTPIAALRTQNRNARTHTKRQIRQIANSIKRFGFTNPILTDDNLQILAGHGRLEAAKVLGLTAVPSIKLSHMSEAEKRAYVIADNAIALKAGWDREILAIELQELVDLGFEIELTGFETAEVDLMLDEWKFSANDDGEPEDEHPDLEATEPVSRLGDLWLLGSHRLLCGDARYPESYRRLLGSDQADLVFTDPPYNVQIDGHVSGLGRIQDNIRSSGRILDGIGYHGNGFDGRMHRQFVKARGFESIDARVVPDVGPVSAMASKFDVVRVRRGSDLKEQNQFVFRPIQRTHSAVVFVPNTEVKKRGIN